MGGSRQPVPIAVWVGGVVLAALLVGLLLLAQAGRSLDYLAGGDPDVSDLPADLRSVLAGVLEDAPASQRSGVTGDERRCGAREGSPGASSSATQVWTLQPRDRAEALDRIEERAVALGYGSGAVQDQVDQDQPVPVLLLRRVEEPSVIEVRSLDADEGADLSVTVYVMCPP
jgi:hypothetical protein